MMTDVKGTDGRDISSPARKEKVKRSAMDPMGKCEIMSSKDSILGEIRGVFEDRST
jgi:hypothetical protein